MSDDAVRFVGEDQVERDAGAHREHLVAMLERFGEPSSDMFDEDVARRVRRRLDAFDNWQKGRR